jgi:hypothetical protein
MPLSVWDSFGTTVTQAEVKANADYMGANLKSHGWQYIMVDIQWSEQNPKIHGYRPNADLAMDQFGRLIPAPNRFPSSANGRGFRPLADYVHSEGLKFGIHIMRGIPRKAVEANLAIAGSKLKAADIANKESICRWNSDMSRSTRWVNRSRSNKRPIVLSLSPGTRDDSKAKFLGTHAQMWRISGDFWDR